MEEYHDILFDLGYAQTWEEATMNLENLYGTRPPLEAFYEWRDLRVMDEANWYGYVDEMFRAFGGYHVYLRLTFLFSRKRAQKAGFSIIGWKGVRHSQLSHQAVCAECILIMRVFTIF